MRTYDSAGNFQYDDYEYPFPYAYKISVAEFQAGFTAAMYAAGERPSSTGNQPPITPVTPTDPTEHPSTWAANDVERAGDLGLLPPAFLSGYRDTTTRAEFAALSVALYEKLTGAEVAGRTTFTDTNDVNVQKAAYIQVVQGVGDGRFDPDAPLTREQAATMLSRLASALGSPLPAHVATFADTRTVSPWALDAVGQMQASGIMGGVGANMFSPQGQYTREQSIVTIIRMYDYVA